MVPVGSPAGTAERMPALYLSHGAPPLADDPLWPGQLADWAARLPRPKAILMVSAHWEESPLALGATGARPLVYDFTGFAPHYYRVRYEAPGAPRLAASVRALLGGSGTPVQDVPERGLDHGAYVPLVEMYPDADIPVLQISLPTLEPGRLMEIGRRLAPLREEGVLLVGSGFFTHNLAALRHRGTPSWSTEFDDWGHRALAAADVDALLDFRHTAPAGQLAHPRTEHFAPLFVTLGAAEAFGELGSQRSVIDGFWLGLAKRSVQFG
ncbi:extradiol ring-cleavage dioxygenase III subunit B [Streptomyces albus]|uniref:Extradiol ring-cleavage dioxygenase III subunit B n=1 Tax=Streptomyces albus (strain ATCC 21838 / DSM 41398 / FERM P-419 / JCM 4703 / NBRC 107858) TaxID=1081613 RepID=A0A0B5EPQ0_STRA4|nr:extradiol ring-cleavage dioxygenase III subunit B [Streptomyces albus]AOU79048.1 extradiol ring-cleavage dioxygenase III subunit B [Streptomyces albus]